MTAEDCGKRTIIVERNFHFPVHFLWMLIAGCNATARCVAVPCAGRARRFHQTPKPHHEHMCFSHLDSLGFTLWEPGHGPGTWTLAWAWHGGLCPAPLGMGPGPFSGKKNVRDMRTHIYMVSLGHTWTHLDSLGPIWNHLGSSGLT